MYVLIIYIVTLFLAVVYQIYILIICILYCDIIFSCCVLNIEINISSKVSVFLFPAHILLWSFRPLVPCSVLS